MQRIIIATIKSWNVKNYKLWRPQRGFQKSLISEKKDLNYEKIKRVNPRFIFFPHWSWIIPEEIYNSFECIVFHMTDLPYGRGGSPLQNLIIRGIYKTKISAIKVTGGLDAGHIYLKRPLSLKRGSAQEIYENASKIIFDMISEILFKNPRPKAQAGKVVIFKRRKPEESRIPPKLSSRKLYDFIRMLDAEGYPRAFIEHDGYRVEFSGAGIKKNIVSAEATFYGKEQ